MVGVLTCPGRCGPRCTSPPLDAHGRLRVAAAIGVNGDVAARAEALLAAGVDILVVDTAHGHQEKMLEALRAVAAPSSPRVPVVAGNVVTAAGHPRPDRGRCRHRQGRRGPGRDVHHADADRRGPPAVLGGARVRRGGRAELGRTCGPTAACGTRATWPSPWPPAPAKVMIGSWFAGTYESPGDLQTDPDGRAYKESASGWPRRAPCAGARPTTSAFDRARKAMFEEGISHLADVHRPGAPRRGGPAGHDHLRACASACTYAGARHAGGVPRARPAGRAVAPPASPRAGRWTRSW